MHPTLRLSLILIVMLMLVPAGGCEPEYRVIRSGWDNFPQDPNPADAGEDAPDADEWTVVLHQFTGPGRRDQASELMRRLEDERRIDDLWIGERDGTVTVYRGRYDRRQDAQRALRRSQRLRLDGDRPFQAAALAPLGRGHEPSEDPMDLRQYTGQYSLQIGYFSEDYDGDRRETAEEIANALREAGYEAYYYHGPHHSLVTLGLYHYESAFVTREDPRAPGSTVDSYASVVQELQERFPYNIGDTEQLIEAQRQEHERQQVQPSALVRVF